MHQKQPPANVALASPAAAGVERFVFSFGAMLTAANAAKAATAASTIQDRVVMSPLTLIEMRLKPFRFEARLTLLLSQTDCGDRGSRSGENPGRCCRGCARRAGAAAPRGG